MSSGKPYTPLNPTRQARQLLRQWLESGTLVLMDGAMGTELLRRQVHAFSEFTCADWRNSPKRRKKPTLPLGIQDHAEQFPASNLDNPFVATNGKLPLGERLAALNVCQPELVRKVHEDYLGAGSRCLVTNTFLAWPRADGATTDRYYRQLNRLAVQIAREVAVAHKLTVPILASIGPWPDDSSQSVARCVSQLRALREADAFLLETQSSLAFVEAVVQEISQRLTRPIFVSFTFRRQGNRLLTWPGQHSPEEIADWAQQHRSVVRVLGVNCGYALQPEDFVEIVRRFRQRTELLILARPYAGEPVWHRGQANYPQARQFLVGILPALVQAGARWLGGCCGSTPKDIRAMRRVLQRIAPSRHLQLA